jgi:hypothetical protein
MSSKEGESMGSARGRATGHGRGARGLLGAVAIAAVSLVAVAPSSSVAASPPGAILTAGGATLISAVIPAPANSTYRSLLPSGITPPANRRTQANPNRPSVKLTGLNVTPVGIPTVFESYAMLRSRYCGQNGWYNRGDGANTPLVKVLGDSLGISKYTIDSDSSLGPDATDPNLWQSRARLDGAPFITLTWRKNPRRVKQMLRKHPWQRHWLRGSGAPYEAPIWDALPVPGQEGQLSWIDANSPDSADPPQWTNSVGVVTVQVRQGVDPGRTYGDWMSLVPKTVKVPGVLQAFNQGTSYVTLRREALGAC